MYVCMYVDRSAARFKNGSLMRTFDRCCCSGKEQRLLWKNTTSNEIESLDHQALKKLYARYETYMGGVVTKSMKKHIVTAYTNIVGLFLPKNLMINDRKALEDSLNKGPFIDLALNKWTCGMYHKFGHMLASVEAMLLTSNHLKKVKVEEVTSQSTEDSADD